MQNCSLVYYENANSDEVKTFILDMFKRGKYNSIMSVSFNEGSHIFSAIYPDNLTRVIPTFKITFLKDKIVFPQPSSYWAYYIQCCVRNEAVTNFNMRLVQYTAQARVIPAEVTFKNYLNFLRYMFKGKEKQAARKHYLKELKVIPPAAVNMEGGIKTFL